MNSSTPQDNITHYLTADHPIILLVGPPGCGKSRLLRNYEGVGVINVGKELVRELIPLSEDARSESAVTILDQLIAAQLQPIVALDNIELLLRPELNIDLWSALDTLSTTKRLVVAWTGQVEGKKILWGHPGVPGHRVLSLENCPARIVTMTG